MMVLMGVYILIMVGSWIFVALTHDEVALAVAIGFSFFGIPFSGQFICAYILSGLTNRSFKKEFDSLLPD